jgi:hypothetical protein
LGRANSRKIDRTDLNRKTVKEFQTNNAVVPDIPLSEGSSDEMTDDGTNNAIKVKNTKDKKDKPLERRDSLSTI